MTKPIKRTGRPSKEEKQDIYSSKLYVLLKENLSSRFIAADGRIDTVALAEALENHRFTIYRWFNGHMMSVPAAKKLAQISAKSKDKKGAITVDMLKPFFGL